MEDKVIVNSSLYSESIKSALKEKAKELRERIKDNLSKFDVEAESLEELDLSEFKEEYVLEPWGKAVLHQVKVVKKLEELIEFITEKTIEMQKKEEWKDFCLTLKERRG